MSKLPKHLQEAQELFRARMDEHKRRIDALFEDEEYLVPSERLLAEIRSSKILETTTAEKFVSRLGAELAEQDAETLNHLSRTIQ
jgi:hypothetical protein